MSMLQTPTGQTSREAATAAAVAAQKKKGIKSSLGRFFSKKEKVSGELFYLWLLIITVTPFLVQVKGVKDSMPDGSTSMMSMSQISMSDVESNYDTMSISGGRIPSKSGSVSSSVDYGRQKKK